ncbi:hypothetical protein D0Z08_19555 [Nocardioides immobilis]|uniref:Uncharacterized protein n=1 Tax=Nocardioides immobilis TaxID=2049295 RepID=A0A417XYI8_9ACTN|nr:hypothetical protein [Nocardioides immobilis]RHW25425.1 hypothetical protein D0Z08_19555 [Nocardioides immobilis]
MPDITQLRRALADYATVLEEKQAAVRDALSEVESAYAALRDVYGGDGAQQFRRTWDMASDAFRSYDEGVPVLLEQLRDKIDQLAAIDRAD